MHRGKKVRITTRFTVPKTLQLPKNPQYPRKSIPHRNKLDQFAVLKYPLTTEAAMKEIENHNTLTFIVDVKSNKPMIKRAIEKMYDVKAMQVNTLIR